VVSKKHWAPPASVEVGEVRQTETGAWVVSGRLALNGICPECGTPSRQRHGWRRRRIEDFPAQGRTVWIELRVCRWRCSNSDCSRRTFSDREAAVATPYARRTSRQAQLLGHMAHAAGGTPAERLLRRLGIRVLAGWRRAEKQEQEGLTKEDQILAPVRDPETGHAISPVIAAALCIKPRGKFTWIRREK
jgi:transposase